MFFIYVIFFIDKLYQQFDMVFGNYLPINHE